MNRPPAYHFWKYLMKNMIPKNSDLIANLDITIYRNDPDVNDDTTCTKARRCQF